MPERDEAALVPLADLELGAALIADPGAVLRFKDPRKWERFGERVAEAMSSRRRILVITAYADRLRPDEQWRVPLAEAPSPWREDVMRALAAIARRHDRAFRPELVEFVF